MPLQNILNSLNRSNIMVKNKKTISDLAIWGQPPPPFGGISIHISRLLPILNRYNISYQLYNLTKSRSANPLVKDYSGKIFLWVMKLFLGPSEKVHYIFTTRPFVRFITVLFGLLRRRIIIMSIHGASLRKSIFYGSVITRLMAKFSIRYADVIIGVNNEICELAIANGANPEKVYHIPAYIPPQNNSVEQISEILSFYSDKSPRLLISGFLKARNMGDLYGIWQTLDILPEIINVYPRTGLIIILQNEISFQSPLIIDIKNEISKRGLTTHVMIHLSKSELWPIFSKIDIYLRPTQSDGDAVSIREAIDMRVPVVASDCVRRLDVVQTFSTGDNTSYIITLKNTIVNIKYYREILKDYKLKDNSIPLIQIIKNKLENH
jgi:glycosyltransferase involved in cell wall biosynthesis